jgi:F-type H+-transporting ATPase subunit epsilon
LEQVRLQILSPERVLFEREVDWLQVPLADGLLGIWPQHAPLIASLSQGTIRFHVDEGVKEMAVGVGILRLDGEQCTVLTGFPVAEEKISDFDSGRATEGLEEALRESLSDEEIEDLQRG